MDRRVKPGGDEEGYTPNPSTAAGRAAALRGPAAPAQRPTIMADEADEPKPRSAVRRWLMVGAAIVVLALLAVGFLVARNTVRTNYFVGSQDGNVVIFQGSPDKVLFIDLSSAHERACVTGTNTASPEITFAEYGSDDTCTPLQLADLTELDRTAVAGKSIRNMPIAEAQNRVEQLNFLPLCPDPQPTPAPQPAPAPGSQPAPGAPAPAATQPATATSPAPAPGQSPAPTSSTPPTSQTEMSPQSPPQYDSDGNKICRGH